MKRLLITLLALPLIAGFSPMSTPAEKGTGAYSAGRYDDALSEYLKAVEENPDEAGAHYNLGCAYYKKGEYDKALGEYQEALRLDPNLPEAHYNAGDALYRMGMYDKALDEFRKADRLKKGDKDTEHNISVTLARIKKEQPKTGGPKPDQGRGQGNQGKGAGSQGSGGGQGPASGQSQGGPPQMSNEEVQVLLDRQKREEKDLRNYFRPGRKDAKSDRESQIEQMLRAAGLSAVPARPPAPNIEKDW